MNTVHNARMNLLATALNNLALAFIVAGFIAPVVGGQFYGGWHLLVAVFWACVGIILHIAGQVVLGRLRQ